MTANEGYAPTTSGRHAPPPRSEGGPNGEGPIAREGRHENVWLPVQEAGNEASQPPRPGDSPACLAWVRANAARVRGCEWRRSSQHRRCSVSDRVTLELATGCR